MTRDKLACAFNEWERRHRDDPDGFAATWPADGTYGERCADYLLELLGIDGTTDA